MKPKEIHIVRHAQSIGNVDWTNYSRMPDEDIPLSALGNNQAYALGLSYDMQFGGKNTALYSSHYYRALQTAAAIQTTLGKSVTFRRIDEDLRELKWSDRKGVIETDGGQNNDRQTMKSFTASLPGGESAEQVYNRMSGVIDRLNTDFALPDYPEYAIIVSHGITIRCFLMKFLNWPVSVYERLKSPENCQSFKLVLGSDGKYSLSAPYPLNTDQNSVSTYTQ